MMIVLTILLLIIIWSLSNVVRYGQGVAFPNFRRVDRILSEKNDLYDKIPEWSKWNSKLGKTTYYVFICLLVYLVSCLVLMIND